MWFGIGCDASKGKGNIAWNGDVAAARIYDKPLDETEIKSLYQNMAPSSEQFIITSVDACSSCEVSPGYHYYIYGEGFQSGDIVQFVSVTTERRYDCTSSVGNGRIEAVIPNDFETDKYQILILRGDKVFPIATVTMKVTSNAPLCSNIKPVAHRGYHPDKKRTENSMAALKSAQELGVYGSEFDVWMTKDGGLFVNHDGKLNGVTIESSTTAQVQNLTLENGEKISTLQAYLEQGKKVPNVKMILEIKSHQTDRTNQNAASACIELVKSLGMTDQVEWIAFNYSICKQIRAELPDAVVEYLEGVKSPSAIAKDKISAIDYSMKVLNKNPKWIQEAHDNQMFVNVWTVPKEEFSKWISKGVDVITTNDANDLMNTIRIYAEK